jgi:hypothetical protein
MFLFIGSDIYSTCIYLLRGISFFGTIIISLLSPGPIKLNQLRLKNLDRLDCVFCILDGKDTAEKNPTIDGHKTISYDFGGLLLGHHTILV